MRNILSRVFRRRPSDMLESGDSVGCTPLTEDVSVLENAEFAQWKAWADDERPGNVNAAALVAIALEDGTHGVERDLELALVYYQRDADTSWSLLHEGPRIRSSGRNAGQPVLAFRGSRLRPQRNVV